MAEQHEVFAALMSERQYQDVKWGDNLDKTNMIKDYVQYMENYLVHLKAQVNADHPILDQLAGIRKVAGIAVKAMEVFGAPQRFGYPVEITKDVIDEGPELTAEQLDALVRNGDPTTIVEFNKWYRVNEIVRVYHYDQGSESAYTHQFEDIRAFSVSSSGNHRLIDKRGTEYFVKSGWTVLAVPKAEVL